MFDRHAEARRMRAELLSRARHRDELCHECQSVGRYEDARRHSDTARDYREKADKLLEAA